MRDVNEAHYLHLRQGLEAVLRPPVQNPTALAWIPGAEELLVSDRSGVIHAVDPVLGTRVVARDVGEAACLAIDEAGTRFLVIGRGGDWLVGSLDGEILHRGLHGFLGGMGGFFLGDRTVMVGDEVDGRRLLVARDEAPRIRARLPERVIPTVDDRGALVLARSTAAGLQLIRLEPGAHFTRAQTTAHRLRASGHFIIGLTPTGLCVWPRLGGPPRSMRLPELTAGDVYRNGELMGLGTRSGAVALARLDAIRQGSRPDLVKAFDHPVTTVAFSTKGRWLATGADSLQLWTWED